MQPEDITCGRLVLQPWTTRDEQALVTGRNDPEVRRWTGVPVPYSTGDARAFLQEGAPRGWAEGTEASFAVHDATTGVVLGGTGLHRIDLAAAEASVHYWLLPEGRGRGAAVEATAAVCRWGFSALGLERIGWGCCAGNWASRAVAQQVGFTVEGLARRAFRQRGTRMDDWTGSLLAGDPLTDTRPLPSRPDLTDGVVRLRRWQPSDAADVARACDDPQTARWLPVPSPYTNEDGAFYVGELTPASWADGDAAEQAVVDASTGELLGACGLKLRQRAMGVGEVGYWTAPWARGRGVASRAAALVAAWGLRDLGLSRVELLAEVGNDASLGAALKAGFVREGVCRAARRDRYGVAQDMVLLSRTA